MAQVSTTTITQLITTGGPANDQAFQGWYLDSSSTWEDIACPSYQTYSTLGNYAQCCDSGDTACSTLWSSCNGKTPIGIPATWNSCGVCATMSIFQDTADQYPITKIVCADAWLAYTVYRNIVINSTTTSVFTISDTTTTSKASFTTSTTVASPGSSGSSSIAPTAAQTSSNNHPSSTDDTGLIAGAVVGPVVGVALGALALWFLCIRKRRSKSGEANTGATTPHELYYSEIPTTQRPDTKVQLPIYNQTGSYEMSAHDRQRHELPTDVNG